ncbi:hypothetical protein AB1339_35785, partial [Streptomyces cyaneofuscatus]
MTTDQTASTPAADTSATPLTLAEKASLTSGGGDFVTSAVDRAGVPAITLSDGPHGLRLPKEAGD